MQFNLIAPWADVVFDEPYPMTATEFAQLADDARYELVDGRRSG